MYSMSEVLLHLHIPKAGGSTMRGVLFDQYALADDAGNDSHVRYGIYYYPADVLGPEKPQITETIRHSLGRDDIHAVLGHFRFGIHANVPRKSTYVTMLREPADRLVSLYQLLVQLPDRYGFHRGTGFHDFVTNPPFREVYNDQTRRIAGAEPGPGASRRDVLELARENLLRHFSVVGTMERFDETLILLKQRFGWTKPIQYFPRRQQHLRPSVRSLPKKTLNAIRELNTLDYELYDFADALVEEAIARAGPEFAGDLEVLQFTQLATYNQLAWQQSEDAKQQKPSMNAKSRNKDERPPDVRP
jgi:hypothetical protein